MKESEEFPFHTTYPHFELPPYNDDRPLGKGRLGSVVSTLGSIKNQPGELFTLKTIIMSTDKKTCAEDEALLLKDISKLQGIKHKHLATHAATYFHESPYVPHFGILMTPFAECNLEDYLHSFWKGKDTVYEDKMPGWFECLVSALEYLHDQGMYHGRISASNILVHLGDVRFTDFGIHHKRWEITHEQLWADSSSKPIVHYEPPEMKGEDKYTYTKPGDVFSLAAVFLEIITVFCNVQALDRFRTRMSTNRTRTHTQTTKDPKTKKKIKIKTQSKSKHVFYANKAAKALHTTRSTAIGSTSRYTGELEAILDICEEMLDLDPGRRPSMKQIAWCWIYSGYLPFPNCGSVHYTRRDLLDPTLELEEVLKRHEWVKAKAIIWLNQIYSLDARDIRDRARERSDEEVLVFLQKYLVYNGDHWMS
ncbi:kinase-like domain-containing protein [Aspergillus unguis]